MMKMGKSGVIRANQGTKVSTQVRDQLCRKDPKCQRKAVCCLRDWSVYISFDLLIMPLSALIYWKWIGKIQTKKKLWRK